MLTWQTPVTAWVLTRLLCVSMLFLGGLLFPVERSFSPNLFETANPHYGTKPDLLEYFHEYQTHFREPDWQQKSPMLFVTAGGDWAWARPLIHWDTLWWLSVAEVGYVADPQVKTEQNVVFYPLYPLLIRGLKFLGIHPILGALLIANSVMLLATCLFYRLIGEQFGRRAADWSIWLWLTFPTSFFGTVPYSEPLMALFSVCVMRSFLRQEYLSCGLWAGIASALRNQGVLLGACLLVPFFRGPKRGWALLGGLCSGIGLAAYMYYLWKTTGNPLYFLDAQKIWRPKISDNNPLHWFTGLGLSALNSLQIVLSGGPKFEFCSGRLLDPWLGIWTALWLPAVYRWNRGLFLISLAMILLPLATGTPASLGRYMWAILPVFAVMGHRLARSGLRWPILLASVCGLMWQAFLFGGGWEVI